MASKRVYTVEVVQRWLQRYRVSATSREEARQALKEGRADVQPDGVEFLGTAAGARVLLQRQPDGRPVEP